MQFQTDRMSEVKDKLRLLDSDEESEKRRLKVKWKEIKKEKQNLYEEWKKVTSMEEERRMGVEVEWCTVKETDNTSRVTSNVPKEAVVSYGSSVNDRNNENNDDVNPTEVPVVTVKDDDCREDEEAKNDGNNDDDIHEFVNTLLVDDGSAEGESDGLGQGMDNEGLCEENVKETVIKAGDKYATLAITTCSFCKVLPTRHYCLRPLPGSKI